MSEVKYGSLREKIAAEKKERAARYANFEAVFNEANRAGFAAGEASKPAAMIVSQHANALDDNSAVEKQWLVPDGVCGFAWVKVKPANCSFAKWLIKSGNAKGRAYGGGIDIWISAHGQSYERKVAHASAMAKVLSEKLGIKCYADSRLD